MALEDDFRAQASGNPGPNVLAICNIAARPGSRIQLGMLLVSYSAAVAAGRLIVGSTISSPELDIDIVSAGGVTLLIPVNGLTFEVGQPIQAILGQGGAAVVGKVSLSYRYVRDR
jgi:hypothetical protein